MEGLSLLLFLQIISPAFEKLLSQNPQGQYAFISLLYRCAIVLSVPDRANQTLIRHTTPDETLSETWCYSHVTWVF